MSSLLHRGLHASLLYHRAGIGATSSNQGRPGDVGHQSFLVAGAEQDETPHRDGPEYTGTCPLESMEQCRSAGVAMVSELPASLEEF